MYMSSDSQNSISMLSSQVHTCAQTFMIPHTHSGFQLLRSFGIAGAWMHVQNSCAHSVLRPARGRCTNVRKSGSQKCTFSSSQVHTRAQTLKGMLSGTDVCTPSHRACLCTQRTCAMTIR